MDPNRRELVEKIGVFHEKFGYQPVAARINALLIVSAKSKLSFEEIREELQVSKSSVSNGINLLLRTKQIDYITHPGERKRYFYSTIENWPKLIERLFDFAISYKNLFLEVLETGKQPNTEFNQSIKQLTEFIDRLLEEVPHLLHNSQDAS